MNPCIIAFEFFTRDRTDSCISAVLFRDGVLDEFLCHRKYNYRHEIVNLFADKFAQWIKSNPDAIVIFDSFCDHPRIVKHHLPAEPFLLRLVSDFRPLDVCAFYHGLACGPITHESLTVNPWFKCADRLGVTLDAMDTELPVLLDAIKFKLVFLKLGGLA